MSFLQPWLLVALPLVALPIIIHLINQLRFQTIPWGAMMFLLAAHRMTRGYSRLRQLLIMAMRVLAIAGLIFAISRPLASGWLGLAAGGKADTTLILLDRSPSMQQRGSGAGDSKLETGRKQLVQALETLGSSRWVLIDSATRQPFDLESPAALASLPSAGVASAPADLPLMLQAAHDYIRDNRPGRTEIWICSDLRENDWNPDDGRWASLRDALLEFPAGVRIHLLAYPRVSPSNIALRVTDIRRQTTSDGAELLLSLHLAREGSEQEKVRVPVQFEIEGARSVIDVELVGASTDVKEHRIPLERARERGWGRVSIPADANPADNDYYFVFDNPPPRRAIVVSDDPQVERPLLLAAGIAPDPAIHCAAESVAPDKLTAVEWDQIATVLWQSPLPEGPAADLIEKFVARGGQVVFFPPVTPNDQDLFGIRWRTWTEAGETAEVDSWRSDEDLLGRTLSGTALPVGQLQVRNICGVQGEFTPLATLKGGAPLLVRALTQHGGAYFWGTTPAPRDSSLATSGIVFYAFVQRSLAAGAAVLGKAVQLNAGDAAGENPATWSRVAEEDGGISTEFAYHRGVYASGDRLLAVNRPAAEDTLHVVNDGRLAELFRGLEFVRVDDQAGSLEALIQEIWRAFMMAMLIALLAEAALCLPKISRAARAA